MKKWDFLNIFLLTLTIPLFFYKLGQSSLGSWDEAWYGDVARTLVKTGDLFHLKFNGYTFYDQPPGGIWITATFFKLFGISELTARLSSAILGLFSLYLIYILGKVLFNRLVGLGSAFALGSSFWFLSRARSGNLDIPLVFFLLLTLYLAIKASQNRKFFIPFCISFAFALITKSLLSFAILPSLVIIFWGSKKYKIKDFFIFLFSALFLYVVWLVQLYLQDPFLLYRHFFLSLRGSTLQNNFFHSFQLSQNYLHNGIGKWYYPGILGLLIGLFLRQKRFLILIVFFISYSMPFLFSKEVQIWHLIPLYPFLILMFFGGIYVIFSKLSRKFAYVFILSFAIYYSFIQFRAAWYQFIDIPPYISDEDILSREAAKYEGKIVIDGDFDPAGAFYSGRAVRKLLDPSLKHFIDTQDNFLLITNTWRLEGQKIDPKTYEIIKQDRDKVLVRKK